MTSYVFSWFIGFIEFIGLLGFFEFLEFLEFLEFFEFFEFIGFLGLGFKVWGDVRNRLQLNKHNKLNKPNEQIIS